MSYVTTAIPPRTVTGALSPLMPRRRARYMPLGAIRQTPFLQSFPNGQRLSALSGYEKSADLSHYTNGQPLESATGTPKQALVVMALHTAMAKKCGCQVTHGPRNVSTVAHKRKRWGMRGMGDDVSATIDSSPEASVEDPTLNPDGSPAAAGPVYQTAGYSPVTGQPEVVPNYPTSAPGIPALSTVPGGYGAPSPSSAIGNTITSLLNNLFRPSTVYPNTFYGQTGNVLAQPLYSGAPFSTGGALLAIGGGVLLISLIRGAGRKR